MTTKRIPLGGLPLILFFLIACLPPAAGASGACAVVTGDRILASDLAKAAPAFQQLPPGEPIGFAPLPGARRVMTREEVVRLCRRYGLPEQGAASACFMLEVKPLTPEVIAEALRKVFSLPDGKGEISVVDFSRQPAPGGDLEFPPENSHRLPDRSDGSILCRGAVRYGQRSWPVWARVKIRLPRMRVVAAADLKQGELIAAGELRLEQTDEWMGRGRSLTEIAHAAGRIPRKTLKAGTVLQAAMLKAPQDVRIGDLVDVEVQSGAARVRFRAKALAGGRRGEAVLMTNQSGGRFKGRIDGPGKATLTVSAAHAGAERKDLE